MAKRNTKILTGQYDLIIKKEIEKVKFGLNVLKCIYNRKGGRGGYEIKDCVILSI